MTNQEASHSELPADSLQSGDDQWRKEILDRVAGYRHRRGRRVEGAFSMRFPFPPAEAEESAPAMEKQQCEVGPFRSVEETAGEAVAVATVEPIEPAELPRELAALENHAAEIELAGAVEELPSSPLEPDAIPESEPALAPLPVPRPRGKRKVIAFPRQASTAPETRYRLADPVIPEQPRILDVPEELEAYPATPLLDGLELPAAAHTATEPAADHVELPFQAVNISRRVYAGLIDCAIVAAGGAAFGAVGYKMLPQLSITKPVLIAAAAVLVVLWAVYQYLFTMYAGATPGMRLCRLRVRTFKGGPLSWRHRRSRVIGLYFSTASLMMGLFWVLVDVDGLCWHDRISRTYLTGVIRPSDGSAALP
jgi:uncharacterized RDD family membrane protein YckC